MSKYILPSQLSSALTHLGPWAVALLELVPAPAVQLVLSTELSPTLLVGQNAVVLCTRIEIDDVLGIKSDTACLLVIVEAPTMYPGHEQHTVVLLATFQVVQQLLMEQVWVVNLARVE